MIDARGRWTSTGHRRLGAVLTTMTATALAAKCGVRKQSISALATGAHRYPSLPLANALERVAGIYTELWEESEPARSMSTPVDVGSVTTLETKPPPRAA